MKAAGPVRRIAGPDETKCLAPITELRIPSAGRNDGNKVRRARISEEDMTSAHQVSDVAGACSGMMDVFHAQRVCPVWNPCDWPNCVPPQRRACVYNAVFFGRNICRINAL